MVGYTRYLVFAALVSVVASQDSFYEARQRSKENDSCVTTNLSRGICTRVRRCRRWREFFLKNGTFGFAHCGPRAVGVICCPVQSRPRPARPSRPSSTGGNPAGRPVNIKPSPSVPSNQPRPRPSEVPTKPPTENCTLLAGSGQPAASKPDQVTPVNPLGQPAPSRPIEETPVNILGQPAPSRPLTDPETSVLGQPAPPTNGGPTESNSFGGSNLPAAPGTLFGVTPSENKLDFTITADFGGNKIDPKEYINMTIRGIQGSKDLLWIVEAPFYANSDSKDAEPGKTLLIGDHEVSSLFLMNDNIEYLEVEVEPYGQYRGFFLHPLRNIIKSNISMTAMTSQMEDTWRGEVIIPYETLPPNITKFNMYHSYRIGEDRNYVSVLPTAIITLSSFHPIDLSKLEPEFVAPTEYSEMWKSAL